MTDENFTLIDDEAAEELAAVPRRRAYGARVEEIEAPAYVLDEIEDTLDDEDDDFDLDLSAEPALTTDSLQLFLNEAGRYKLLTAGEEVELAKRIERGDQRAKAVRGVRG